MPPPDRRRPRDRRVSGQQQPFDAPVRRAYPDKNEWSSAALRASLHEAAASPDLRVGVAGGSVAAGARPLPKVANDIGTLPDRRIKATRRYFLGGATALATRANSVPAADRATPDPIVVLIGEEKRWRLLAVAARERAERLLFALPRAEWPEEFDDHPIMTEAVSLETRADQFDRIIQTPAGTLAGIFAKLDTAKASKVRANLPCGPTKHRCERP